MAIVQKIQYNSDNKYFAGFLQSMINESSLNASVEQNNNEIVLTIDEKDEQALATLSELTSKYLPHIKEFDEYKKNENVKSEYNTIEKFNNQIRNMIDIFLKDNTTIYVSYSLKNDGKDVSLGQLTDYFEAKNYQREYIL